MQYTIGSVNQRAIVEQGFALDLKDCAIIDYCRNFFLSPRIEKLIVWDEVFFWIDYDNLLKEMPLLDIGSKDVLGRRLRKICEQWILCQRMTKTIGSRTFFRFGPNYTKLISDTFVPPDSKVGCSDQDHPTQKSEAPDSKVGDHPTQKSSHIKEISILSSVILYQEPDGSERPIISYFPLYPDRVGILFDKYLGVRRKRRATCSISWILKQVERFKELTEQQLFDTINHSYQNEYLGLFPEKFIGKTNNSHQKHNIANLLMQTWWIRQ